MRILNLFATPFISTNPPPSNKEHGSGQSYGLLNGDGAGFHFGNFIIQGDDFGDGDGNNFGDGCGDGYGHNAGFREPRGDGIGYGFPL